MLLVCAGAELPADSTPEPFARFESAHGICFDEYFRDELVALQSLAADGSLTIGQDAITMTPRLAQRAS